MGRRKGSLNKKSDKVNLEENKEVVMTSEMMVDEVVLDSVQTEVDIARSELEKLKVEIEEKKKELASNPRREITEEEKVIKEKQLQTIDKNKSKNEVIEKQKAHDNQKVRGRFINRRAPGQSVKLTYMKYADDPVKWYEFQDGQIYTISRGFADQINNHYHTPKFVQKEGAQNLSENPGENSMIAEVDTSNKKYAFVGLGFGE